MCVFLEKHWFRITRSAQRCLIPQLVRQSSLDSAPVTGTTLFRALVFSSRDEPRKLYRRAKRDCLRANVLHKVSKRGTPAAQLFSSAPHCTRSSGAICTASCEQCTFCASRSCDVHSARRVLIVRLIYCPVAGQRAAYKRPACCRSASHQSSAHHQFVACSLESLAFFLLCLVLLRRDATVTLTLDFSSCDRFVHSQLRVLTNVQVNVYNARELFFHREAVHLNSSEQCSLYFHSIGCTARGL